MNVEEIEDAHHPSVKSFDEGGGRIGQSFSKEGRPLRLYQ